MKIIPMQVSAVIPCYNHGEYVEDAINSILSQTHLVSEILVVDDGSDDPETLHILDTIDKPRTIVYHKENGGPSSARNYGIERSSHNYILTLDCDDRFDPTFVEKAITVLKNNPKTGMVTSYVNEQERIQPLMRNSKGAGLKSFLVKNDANASLLFRKKCLEIRRRIR